MTTTMKNQEKNGANRCPNCGATDVSLDTKSGKLKCKFCRTLFKPEKSANARGGVDKLKGRTVGSGAADIIPSEKIIVTLKCPACGAEVVINTDEVLSARCHWCRNILSINEKMPNGAVPDLVLPFKTEKSVAEENIREFVKKRRFFAHPTFKKEFAPENVMGVYLPYMVVDVNAHAKMSGEAEHLIRKYSRGSGNSRRTYYDAEAFKVTRNFDLLVDDLTIESSSKRLQQDVRSNTNNVINAIMPFDTENCVDWNPNYLHGFASERRDTNVDDLAKQLKLQVGDIARYKVKETMTYYDRGAKWESEEIEAKGSMWKAAYLPVWLYSYLEDNGKTKMLHYVAVNARTGETMGSVPINKARLLLLSGILEFFGIVLGLYWILFWLGIDVDDDNPFLFGLVGLTPGVIFYWVKCAKYRNMNARHKHEKETASEITNLEKTDVSIGRRNGLRNSRIAGENDSVVKGVVAKSGERMMGEKMANFIGIGRMVGSKMGETVTGQQTIAKAQANSQALRAIGIIFATLFIVPFLIFVVMFIVVIVFGAGDFSKKNSVSVPTSTFTTIRDNFRNYAESHSYVYSDIASEVYIYNRNVSEKYSVFELSQVQNGAMFSVTKLMELSKNDLSKSSFATEAAKDLNNKLYGWDFKERKSGLVSDGNIKMAIRMYTRDDTKNKTYTMCDLREELLSSTKLLGNNYKVELNCVEMDKATKKENKIDN